MYSRILFWVVLMLLLSKAFSGPSLPGDTIVDLPRIDVNSSRITGKENAGIKETRIDTLVMKSKIHLSLSELLSENTPIFINSHGRGAMATAAFRGTAPSHTRVSWNGIHINSPMLGMVDFSLIPVFIIDDISLKHGSASIADGSGGLGGSINLENKIDWDKTLKAAYSQGIGSFGTFDEYLKISAGTGKFQWRTRLYHNYSDNDYTFVNKYIKNLEEGRWVHPLETNKDAQFQKMGILQEISYQPAKNQVLSLRWWGQDAERTIPQATSYEGIIKPNSNLQQNLDHRLSLEWKQYNSKSIVLLRSGYSFTSMEYVQKNHIYGSGMVTGIFSRSTINSFFNHVGYKRELLRNLSVETTLDVNHHSVLSRDTIIKTGYNQSRSEVSALLSMTYNPVSRLFINLLLRQDMVEGEPAPLTPYGGFNFLILPEDQLIWKAGIARNYNRPSLNDLFWQPGGNPNLLPEDGFTIESGLINNSKGDYFSMKNQLTFYHSEVSNWIIWIPSVKGYWQPFNIKRVQSRGIETGTTLALTRGDYTFNLMAIYAYTSSVNKVLTAQWEDESVGKQLVFIPKHSGNIFLRMAYKQLALEWQHNSFSERFTTTSNDINSRDWLYPYFMNDAGITGTFSSGRIHFSVEAKVYNVFNEFYRTVLNRPMPGRNYMLLLRISI